MPILASTMAEVAAVRAAKKELRRKLRLALSAMTDQQKREESEILVRKVSNRSVCDIDSLPLLQVVFHLIPLP